MYQPWIYKLILSTEYFLFHIIPYYYSRILKCLVHNNVCKIHRFDVHFRLCLARECPTFQNILVISFHIDIFLKIDTWFLRFILERNHEYTRYTSIIEINMNTFMKPQNTTMASHTGASTSHPAPRCSREHMLQIH